MRAIRHHRAAAVCAAALAVAVAVLPGCVPPPIHDVVSGQPEGGGVLRKVRAPKAETPPWEVRVRPNIPPMRIVSHSRAGGDHDPDISSDGRWMVFSSTRHGYRPSLYLKSVTSTNHRWL